MTNTIRSHIQKILTQSKDISLSSEQTLELEIRLGKFKNNHFIPGLSEFSFNKLLELFEWQEETIDETIFYNIPEKQRKNTGWILKDNLQKYDNVYESVRVAFNLETSFTFNDVLQRNHATQDDFTKDKIQLFRKKHRYFTIVDHWRIDLTRVEVFNVKEGEWVKNGIVYECEIELNDYSDDCLETFDTVWNTISKIHYSSIVFPIYYGLTKSNKFIGNQPKTLERENMHMLSNDYLVTEKADGERVFLIYTPHNGAFLVDNHVQVICRYDVPTINSRTIIDGEYINGKFLAFDCLFYKGEDIRKENLYKRLEISKILKLETKTFVDIQKCKELMDKTFDYKLDGLIFTPKYQDYNGNIMKWKPKHTIDVYVDENDTIMAYSSKDRKNIPVSSFFTPTNVVQTIDTLPLQQGTITELSYDTVDNVWVPITIRKDKKRPNAVLTILSIVKAITENISLDDILNFLESNYNTPGKTLQHRQENIDINYRKFHNKVKNHLITYPPANKRKTLLDFGCGKGGDIMKWINAGYTDVLAIDFSHTHLYGPNGFSERYEKVKDKINITFVWGNVVKPLAECGMNQMERDKIIPWLGEKFDVISCQFAIHYFLDSKNDWTMFMRNIQLYLKEGGYFVGTYLNAHKLEQLEQKHVFKINETPFYTLTHDNNITFTELNNQQLLHRYMNYWKIPRHKISIHTSEWDTEIIENIIFPEHLEVLLMKGKLRKVETESFETLMDGTLQLSDDEKLLSSLHNYFIYQL